MEAELINKLILQNRGTNQQIEDATDAIERGHTYIRKVAKYWNMPLIPLLDHMNGRLDARTWAPKVC